MSEIKISELAETTNLDGLYTIGTDKNNLSKKVSLTFLQDAANYANLQGDYAKQVGDMVNGNVSKSLLSYFVSGRCGVTGSIGSVAKIERIPNSAVWTYLLISVSKGQKFNVTSRGNSENPSWVILDSNRVIISKASENRQENIFIEVEQDGYLIMNALLDNSYYKDTDYNIVWLNPASMAANVDNVAAWIISEAFQIRNSEYNAVGDVVSADITFPDGVFSKITITRNSDGLVTKLVGDYGNQTYTFTISRNADGSVIATSFNHSLYPNW